MHLIPTSPLPLDRRERRSLLRLHPLKDCHSFLRLKMGSRSQIPAAV